MSDDDNDRHTPPNPFATLFAQPSPAQILEAKKTVGNFAKACAEVLREMQRLARDLDTLHAESKVAMQVLNRNMKVRHQIAIMLDQMEGLAER